jgi:flagellar basal body rod protein FlgB
VTLPNNTLNSLVGKMTWNIARGQRISSNIANYDVPGYQKLDVKPFAQSIRTISQTDDTLLSVQSTRHGIEMSREEEMLKLSENTSNYQANLNIFKKYLGLLKTVIGKMG